MNNLSAEIKKFKSSAIEEIMLRGVSDIDTLSHYLKIDPNYLSIQVRLHLPFFSQTLLNGDDKILVVRKILPQLEKSLKNFSECYQRHRKQNGIDLLQGETKLIGNEPFKIFDKNNNCVAKLNFKEVSKEIGLEIQDKLHYIHSARQDTKHHFGLFIEGKDYPICYAALSEDIREYQIYGLESINKINTTNTIVMTRAFGFSKLPKNTMSKFFQRIKKEISSNTNNLVIVTALNPLLGFKGSIFLGASYIPYMLSPLKYHYDQNGCYLTRRALKDRVVEQQIKTPPIVWLARGLKTFVQKGLESNNNMKLISKNDYDKK